MALGIVLFIHYLDNQRLLILSIIVILWCQTAGVLQITGSFFFLSHFRQKYSRQFCKQIEWFFLNDYLVFTDAYSYYIGFRKVCGLVLLFEDNMGKIHCYWIPLISLKKGIRCLSNLQGFMGNTCFGVLAVLIGITMRNLQLAWILLLDHTQEVNETTWCFDKR